MTLTKRLGLSTFDPFAWPAVTGLVAVLYTAVTGNITLVSLRSYNFQTTELILLILAPFLLLRMGLKPALFSLVGLAWFLYAAIWGFSLLRGNGMDALVSLRTSAIMPLLLLYALLNADRQELFRQCQQLVVIAASIAAAILWARIAFGPQLFYLSAIGSAGINDGGRALSANGALLLAMGAMISLAEAFRLSRQGQSARTARRGFLVLFASLLVSLQATATLAGIAGVFIIAALAPGPMANLRFVAAALGAVMLGIALILAPEIFDPDFWIGLMPSDLALQFQRRLGNLDTRTEIWRGFLAAFENQPLVTQLFGQPAGRRAMFIVNLWGGREWTVSLHSTYFGMLESHGIVGLASFLMLLAGLALKCLRRLSSPASPSPVLGSAIVVALLIFGYGYDLRNGHALYLLLAVGAAFSPRERRRETRNRITSAAPPAPLPQSAEPSPPLYRSQGPWPPLP